MNFREKLNKSKLWKFHQVMAPALFFLMLFPVIGCIDWDVAQVFQKDVFPDQNLHWLITIDKQIPIVSPLVIFYLTAVWSWALIPLTIYFLYGKERYAKVLGVSVFVFIVSLIIKLWFPVSTEGIETYGQSILQAKKDAGTLTFCDGLVLDILNKGLYYSGFPSNHCSEQILLLYAIIEFNFFDRKNKYDPFLKQGNNYGKNLPLRIIMTIVTVGYTIIVCASTFVLKIHYFVDWTASLGLVTIFWILLSIFPQINIFKNWFLKLMVNYAVGFGYESNNKNEYKYQITWANKMFTDEKIAKYTKKEFIRHYFFTDLMNVAVLSVLIVFTSGFVLQLF